MLIVLASAKSSPGVTTTGLALASVWPRPVMLAECDPAGGDVVAGFLRASAPSSGGLLDLALAARRALEPNDVVRRCISLSGDESRVLLLPGVTDPAHIPTVVPTWPRIVSAFAELGDADPPYDVLVDCGRLGPPWPTELVAAADQVLLFLRPTLPQVHSAKHQLARIRSSREPKGNGPAAVVLGEHPYNRAETQAALETPVLGAIAIDQRAAAALSSGTSRGRWFDRSALIRSARQLAATLSEQRSMEAVR